MCRPGHRHGPVSTMKCTRLANGEPTFASFTTPLLIFARPKRARSHRSIQLEEDIPQRKRPSEWLHFANYITPVFYRLSSSEIRLLKLQRAAPRTPRPVNSLSVLVEALVLHRLLCSTNMSPPFMWLSLGRATRSGDWPASSIAAAKSRSRDPLA